MTPGDNLLARRRKIDPMTPKQYQDASRRTMNDKGFKNPSLGLSNWALGLSGEAGEILYLVSAVWDDRTEFDEETLVEEIGDLLWYVSAFCSQLGFDLSLLVTAASAADLEYRHSMSPVIGVVVQAAQVSDYVKKVVHHGHPLVPDTIKVGLVHVLLYVEQICDDMGVELGSVMQKNIDKLQDRYPNGFSTDASLNRDA